MTNREKILSLEALVMLAFKSRKDVEQGIYYNPKTAENICFYDALVNVEDMILELKETTKDENRS